MERTSLNILMCHRCNRERGGICAENGRLIGDNAAADFCPAGRFGNAGGAVERVTHDAEAQRRNARPICESCEHFRGLFNEALYVACAGVRQCCGSAIGEVSLGYGRCPKSRW